MDGILFPRGVVEGREGLKEHSERGGYEALKKVLGGLSPEDVTQEINLRGILPHVYREYGAHAHR